MTPADADFRRADRHVLRPGLAAGRPRRVVARELPPRPHGVGRLARPPRYAAALRAACRRRGVSRRAVPVEGEGDVDRAPAFVAAALLRAAGAPGHAVAPTRRCACARRSCRGACRRTSPRRRSRRCSPRRTPRRRSACATARCSRRSTRRGLRVSELTGLKVAQVSLDMGVVRVLGKGSKERLVPLGEEAIGWIKRYLARGAPGARRRRQERRALRHRAPRPADAAGILGAHQALAAKAGIPAARLSPHVLRHAFATHLAEPRRGPARRAAPARARRHHDDDDLHARRARAPEAAPHAASPARLTVRGADAP